jgi:hypothetical protein
MVPRKAVRSGEVGVKFLPMESLRSWFIPPRAVLRWIMEVLFAWRVIALRLGGAYGSQTKYTKRYAYGKKLS